MTESIEDFLKRGGKITKIAKPDHTPDTRSDYSEKDKIDVVIRTKGKSLGAQPMFNRFVQGFMNNGNNNWKWQK